MTVARARKRRAGLALIELLIVMAMTAVLAAALAYAFSAEVSMQRITDTRRASLDRTSSMETQITRLVEGARLSDSTTDTMTYFQGLTTSGASELGCDRLTFTTTAPGVPMASMDSTDDFETQQTARGPAGGLAEVSLGTTAVGNAGDQTGLFERMQRPSDSDPTQGGNEFTLDADVDSIGFEFWDGLEWVDSWDTTTMTPRRLPAAVQVSYRLKGESGGQPHQFVVPVPASDVTAQNPVTSTGTSDSSTTSGSTTTGSTAGG